MVGNTDGDGIEAGGRQIGNRTAVGFRKNERERSRPERRGKPRRVGIEARQCLRRLQIDDMGDERIERRPALGLVEARNGCLLYTSRCV